MVAKSGCMERSVRLLSSENMETWLNLETPVTRTKRSSGSQVLMEE